MTSVLPRKSKVFVGIFCKRDLIVMEHENCCHPIILWVTRHCVFICMYICIYMCMYILIYICIGEIVYICVCICMYMYLGDKWFFGVSFWWS